MHDGQLLTVRQTAERLALRESTIRSWILSRRIGFVKVGGRAVRIPVEAVEEIVRAGFVPTRRSVARG